MPGEIIAFLLVAAIIAAAAVYIVKAKKSGQKCVGCPYSKNCSGNCSAHTKTEKQNKPFLSQHYR